MSWAFRLHISLSVSLSAYMLPSSEVFAEAIGDGGDNLADRPDIGVENRNKGLFV